MKCTCGEINGESLTRSGYKVLTDGSAIKAQIPLIKCSNCGVIRQTDLPFETEEEYDEFYSKYPPTNGNFSASNYKGNLKTAEKNFERLDKDFQISKAKRILDVGCGSGALVDVCNRRGIETFGCELAKYFNGSTKNIYFDKFENIHFPVDYADIVTCNDVIEHVLDPHSFLEEIFRVTNQEGFVLIEFPHFFHKNATGHWKLTEHIWYFSVEQFANLLKEVGFVDVKPIERIFTNDAKILFYAKKPKQNRIKIMFPPGMGDSMWTLFKLQGFLKAKNIKPPVDGYLVCPRVREHDGHRRSVTYLEMFPFVKSTGKVFEFKRNSPVHKKIWERAYTGPYETVFENVLTCDYFLSYNGYNISYKTLEKCDPYDCNWNIPRFISLEEERFRKQCIDQFGEYLALYIPLYGMYDGWNAKLSIKQLAEAINEISEKTGYNIVIVGREWDRDFPANKAFRKIVKGVDFTGQTTNEQIFGLIRGAKGMLAYPCGLPMMSVYLGQKTLMLWKDYWTFQGHKPPFAENFAKRCVPPQTVGNTYKYFMIDEISKGQLVESAIDLFGKGEHERKIINLEERKVEKVAIKPIVKTEIKTEIAIVCVLKSGPEYKAEHVKKFRKMLDKKTSVKFEFIVLSDVEIDGIKTIPLNRNLPGWWSKLEVFSFNSKPILFFDLDTIITGNIDSLIGKISQLPYGEIRMLTPFNEQRRASGSWASGVMAFNGNFEFLLLEFQRIFIDRFRLDQVYISEKLKEKSVEVKPMQELVEICSYKRHCLKGLPKEAEIVCFHGNPRPFQVQVAWVREAYE